MNIIVAILRTIYIVLRSIALMKFARIPFFGVILLFVWGLWIVMAFKR